MNKAHTAELKKVVTKAKFRALVTVIYERAMDGDLQAANMLLSRLAPPLKPQAEPITMDLPQGDALTQARAVIQSVAGGDVSTPDGKALIDSLSQTIKIQEVTELLPRIEALEANEKKP
jgi:hypothetical protein